MGKYINLIKNIGLFTISNIALKLISFFLIPFYTLYLSTSEYGIVDMLNTVILMVLPLCTLSICDATLRFCIEERRDRTLYATVGLGMTCLSCAIVATMLPLLDLHFFGGLGNYKLWFLLCYSGIAFQTLFSNLARGVNKVKVMTVASIASSLTNFISVVVALAILKYRVEGIFFSLFLGNLVACIYYCVAGNLHKYFTLRIRFTPIFLKKMLVYSLPLIPNSLSWWMTQNINRFFITSILGIGISGMYAAAAKIPSILSLLTSVFDQAWTLSVFQEYKRENTRSFYRTIFTLYNAFLSLCVILLIIFAPQISSIFLKKAFFDAWVYVPILLMSFYYMALNSFWGSIYTSSMKTKYLFITTLIGAMICVVCTYFFVNWWGAIGACVASTISAMATWGLRLIHSQRIMPLFIHVPSLAATQLLMMLLAVINLLSIKNIDVYNIAILLLVIIIQALQCKEYYSLVEDKILHKYHKAFKNVSH